MSPTAPPAPGSDALQALERHRAGDLNAAWRGYRAVLAEEPAHYHANLWLGALLQETGRSEAAEPLLERATAAWPDVPDGWVNLGVVRTALGRHEPARAAFQRALALEPSLPEAWLGLGNLLQAMGDRRAAEEAYRKARRLDPENPRAMFNHATLLAVQGRYGEARLAAEACLERAPELVEAHALRADCSVNLGQLRQALDQADRGLALEPRHADLHYTRGFVLGELGDLEGAIVAFDQALAANPEHGGALAAALFTRRQLCRWQGIDRLLARFRDGLRRGQSGLTPFAFLAEDSTRAEQQACARLWSGQWSLAGAEQPTERDVGDRARLTIGYLSADFYRHPTAYLAAGLFEAHDRARFRILAYSNSREDDSPIRRRLEAAFDDWVDLRGLSPDAAAERVRRDGVDILVDLKGHTLEAATAVVARRPAPIQVQYLGYPGTLGAPFVDYLVADAVVVPEAHFAAYDEAVVHLPYSYQVNDRQRPCPPPREKRADLGLPEDGVVFCCFNNAWKINRACFSRWMAVLRGVPGSVLWLLGRHASAGVSANLRAEAAAQGVAPDRLVFSKSRPLEAYLALYHHADLFLDSWPYNAHTTASDALWMGCPLLTLKGETFASRVGASLLGASGLPELVTQDEDDFEQRAIALGRSPERLAGLRERLQAERLDNPLFDTERFTRALERAYEEMARREREGVRPTPLIVDR